MAAGARCPAARATCTRPVRRSSRCTTAASVAIIDSSWQRGIAYLLKTQAADGTWHVTSRLHPPAPLSPPYFDAGYPHGHDQFLSMQGASWAVMALSYALEPARARGAAAAARDRADRRRAVGRADAVWFGRRRPAAARRAGSSPNAATKSGGTTALMMAAPDVEKMRLLLDRGADVNARARIAILGADGRGAVSGWRCGDQSAARSRCAGRRAIRRCAGLRRESVLSGVLCRECEEPEAAARRRRKAGRGDDRHRHVAHDADARRVQVRRRRGRRPRCSISARRSTSPMATASRCSAEASSTTRSRWRAC